MSASKSGQGLMYGVTIALVLVGIGSLPAWATPAMFSPDKLQYEFPQMVALELVATSGTQGKHQFCGTLEPRVGAPQQVTVHFATAPGWRVVPDRIELPGLTASLCQDVRACLEPASGPAPLARPWVMMRVSYLPDYLSLLKIIKDFRRYPDPIERSRLLGIVRRNFQAKARQTDGVRLDFDLGPPAAAEEKGVQP